MSRASINCLTVSTNNSTTPADRRNAFYHTGVGVRMTSKLYNFSCDRPAHRAAISILCFSAVSGTCDCSKSRLLQMGQLHRNQHRNIATDSHVFTMKLTWTLSLVSAAFASAQAPDEAASTVVSILILLMINSAQTLSFR